MVLRPPRRPTNSFKVPHPPPPSPPPHHPQQMINYPQQQPPATMQNYAGQQQQQQQESVGGGGGFVRQIGSAMLFAVFFGGIISLLTPRHQKITIDHRGSTGPLTPEQLQASVPLHNNRMMNYTHVGLPPEQGRHSPLPPPMQPQSYQRSSLPPPVALPQYQIPLQANNNTTYEQQFQSPPQQQQTSQPKDEHGH